MRVSAANEFKLETSDWSDELILKMNIKQFYFIPAKLGPPAHKIFNRDDKYIFGGRRCGLQDRKRRKVQGQHGKRRHALYTHLIRKYLFISFSLTSFSLIVYP